MGMTTRSDIPAEVNNFYDRTLLTRATPYLVHNRFAQVRDIPRNSGSDTIKFRRYGALTAQTTALTEGVTPAGKKLSITDVTAQVKQYGDFVTLTDKLMYETIDPILTETAEVLGEQAGDSLDQLCRDIISAGTTVQYAGSATSTATVSSTDLITEDEIRQAVRTLRGNNAKPITQMIDPSTGYNTVPIGAAYIGIVSEKTAYDLEKLSNFVPVEKYPNRSNVMENELGALGNVRFIWTTNAKVKEGAGASGIDVHCTLILAKNAYAQTRISGETLRNIVKPLGSAGSADPLDQRATSGWKATYVAKILNQGFIVRIEHAVSS